MRARRFAQRQIDFVSSEFHTHFRTLLAVIYSASENLEDGVAKDDEQVSQYGTLIKGEGKKLSGKLVEQILEFAGADSGNRDTHFEKLVKDVIDDALAECSSLIDPLNTTSRTRFRRACQRFWATAGRFRVQ